MNQHRRILGICAVLACATLSHTKAKASAGGDPVDQFVSRQGTDLPMGRYASGELGVVLKTHPRIYLYPAWRAIVLGRDRMQKFRIAPGGAARSIGRFVDGWAVLNEPQSSAGRWTAASNTLLGSTRSPVDVGIVSWDSYEYRNCPDGAFDFATQTLARLQKRSDATPQRLIVFGTGIVLAGTSRGARAAD